jgi:hypothetical protein
VEIEEGVVSSLEEGDSVEVIIAGKKKKNDRIEVSYTIGDEPQIFKIWVKGDALVGDVRKTIAMAHKGKPIIALASEGAELTEEDTFNDWATRTGGAPRQIQAKIAKLVQVILYWMGSEQQMFARENWTREEFESAVQTHLGTTHKLDAVPLGISEWEVRAGFVYEIRETRKVVLRCVAVDGRKHRVEIAGTKTDEDIQEIFRKQWGTPPWVKIHIKRQDDKPFFMEDEGKYNIVLEYVEADNPRPEVQLRIDLTHRTFLIEKVRIDDDPISILKMITEKYGFPAVKPNQVRFAPYIPWPTGQTARITFKTDISCSAVKLEPFMRREFTLYIADEPWESGQVLLPKAYGKAQIWEHLQSLHPIPDLSQFQVVAGKQEVTKQDKWPAGRIEAIPVTFPVAWKVEMPQEPDGVLEATQDKMSPMITATEAWDQLHLIVPRLYEEANLDFRGKLKPGLTITAEIIRRNIRCTVEFEAIRKGSISYIHEVIPNMATWAEIHAHYSSFDKRIPPFESYVNEENRPYHDDMRISFRLVKGVEIPDTTQEFGGASGGVSQGGFILPPIVFPKTVDVS